MKTISKVLLAVFLGLCCELFAVPSLSAETTVTQKISFSAEINNLIDENYNLVCWNGYAKLVIPQTLHGIVENQFSPNCIAAAKTLIEAGHKAYVIGGAVRDLIMGKTTNDFDIVTSATNDEIKALPA